MQGQNGTAKSLDEKTKGLEYFAGALTILFIGLKLTDNIDWSWWWVLSPMWLPALIILFIIGIIFLVISFIKK